MVFLYINLNKNIISIHILKLIFTLGIFFFVFFFILVQML